MSAMITEVSPDLLVANAGRGGAMAGPQSADAAEIETVVQTNVTALIQTVQGIGYKLVDRDT